MARPRTPVDANSPPQDEDVIEFIVKCPLPELQDLLNHHAQATAFVTTHLQEGTRQRLKPDKVLAELQRLELDVFVREQAQSKPLLGICLGMQVLLDHSEENEGVDALGLIPGKVVRFPDPPAPKPGEQRLKVPHMGWNRVRQAQAHPLWQDIPDESWFYFVHSYHAQPTHVEHVLGEATYTHAFAAAIGQNSIF